MSALFGMAGGGRQRWLVLAVTIGVAGFFAYQYFSGSLDGKGYEETIGEVTKKFGDDAKVVRVSAGDESATYEVLAPDGTTVFVRSYTRECNNSGPKGEKRCSNETDDKSRPATPEEQKATITLGSFDEGLLGRMFDAAGIDEKDGGATFDGTHWRLTDAGAGLEQWQADADGANVRKLSSQEVLGGPTPGVPAPAPPATPDAGTAGPKAQAKPPASIESVQAMSECVQKANGDIAKMQACVSQ